MRSRNKRNRVSSAKALWMRNKSVILRNYLKDKLMSISRCTDLTSREVQNRASDHLILALKHRNLTETIYPAPNRAV